MATITLRLGPADHGRAMTLDDFLEADADEGYRYELARGVVEVTQVPNDPHGELVWTLLALVAEYDRAHPGRIRRAGGGGEFQLCLPGMVSGRNPDVAVALAATPKDPRGRRPPSLVMEVISEGAEARDRDYRVKLEEYLAFGLREYWIVDRAERRVTVLRRDGDAWSEQRFGDGQSARGLVLPGFEVPVAGLWALPDDGEGDQAP